MPPKGWVFSISESWKILIGHEKVMEKSLNFIAQFLYEPCKGFLLFFSESGFSVTASFIISIFKVLFTLSLQNKSFTVVVRIEQMIIHSNLGQVNLISGSTDFFQNLKGQSVGKKRKIKKNPQFFALALIINKSFNFFRANPASVL